MWILSIQSGTSADGIDVAIARFSHRTTATDRPDDSGTSALTTVTISEMRGQTHPLPPTLTDRVLAANDGAALDAAAWCALDTELGQAFAVAARNSCEHWGLQPDLVVSHGQTVYHWVEEGTVRGTLQLGEAAWIAEELNAPVLWKLRSADIAAGGQGAPLMAVFDKAWLHAEAFVSCQPIASLNLGGIANLQIVYPDGSLTAFDTGPANALIDTTVSRRMGTAYDIGGELGLAGTVDETLLMQLLAHPYFQLKPPKTTGRDVFNHAFIDTFPESATLTTADLVATLVALTSKTITDALPMEVSRVIASGGGVHNPALMASLSARLAARGATVESSTTWGLDADFKESLMFALLGYLHAQGVEMQLQPEGPVRPIGALYPGPQRTAQAANTVSSGPAFSSFPSSRFLLDFAHPPGSG